MRSSLRSSGQCMAPGAIRRRQVRQVRQGTKGADEDEEAMTEDETAALRKQIHQVWERYLATGQEAARLAKLLHRLKAKLQD